MKKSIIFPIVFLLALLSLVIINVHIHSLRTGTKTTESANISGTQIDEAQFVDEDGTRYELVESIADIVTFEYEDLKERADVIALVEIEDSLANAKSNIIYDENGAYIFDYYQSRQVKVLQYYKNSMDNKEVIEVIEPCAVHQNQLLTIEGYKPLCKGKTYLLFLDYADSADLFSVISAGLSVIPMEDIQEADDLDIAYKAILDFGESDIAVTDKKEILSQEKIEHNKNKDGKDAVITLEDYEFNCNYLKSEDGYSLMVE